VGTTVSSGQEYRAGYVQLPLGGARSVNIFTCLGFPGAILLKFPNQNFELIFSLLSFLKERKEVYEITMAVPPFQLWNYMTDFCETSHER
jgi:hypothetical protein